MRFSQVNVFSSEPLLGNPVAVVHDAEGVTDQQMAAFARWTNLSETTFLLEPSETAADYRLRIWTPEGELPFAGHPTLGSAHAWLEAGGVPAGEDLIQECSAGNVRIRRDSDQQGRLSFRAPVLVRSGAVAEDEMDAIAVALAVPRTDIIDAEWIDNGVGWVGVLLRDADAVLNVQPNWAAFGDFRIGVVGPYAAGPVAVEVRALGPGHSMTEDPVTGSLNAGVGQWLAGNRLPAAYIASQGALHRRAGRIHVELIDKHVWVGGETHTTIAGAVYL